VDSLCNQKWVTAQTPQTFLAHGDADNAVPIQNSRMFDSACKAFHVTDTLIVDPGKGHGYGMNGIWPEVIDLFLPDGRCVARYSGAGIKAIYWQPPSLGMYIAKIRTKNRNAYVFRISSLN
jgi:hypothetical protein